MAQSINFLVKNLGWSKKIKLAPSIRYPKGLDLGLKNKVFLPYEIFDEQVILNEFKRF